MSQKVTIVISSQLFGHSYVLMIYLSCFFSLHQRAFISDDELLRLVPDSETYKKKPKVGQDLNNRSMPSTAMEEASPPLAQYPLTSPIDDIDMHLLEFIENTPRIYNVRQKQNKPHGELSFEIPSIPKYENILGNRKKLPVYERRQEILDAIQNHQVIVISGETGSGKTTQIPQYVLNECARLDKPTRILVTQPRRLAAKEVAKRVAYERNTELGNTVGYRVKNDICVSKNSNLIFLTR